MNNKIVKTKNGVIIYHKNGEKEGFFTNLNKNDIPLEEIKSRHIIESLLIIGLGITYFNTDITIVVGSSMEPTLKSCNVIINPSTAKNVKNLLINRNSIIKFKSPEGDNSIKRVVGVPGDKIEFDMMHIKINGEIVDDDNNEEHPKNAVKSQAYTHLGKPRKKSPISTIILGPDQYFVMGDNKLNSIDSRRYGPIEKSCILSLVQK
jgi:signal peptidase I